MYISKYACKAYLQGHWACIHCHYHSFNVKDINTMYTCKHTRTHFLRRRLVNKHCLHTCFMQSFPSQMLVFVSRCSVPRWAGAGQAERPRPAPRHCKSQPIDKRRDPAQNQSPSASFSVNQLTAIWSHGNLIAMVTQCCNCITMLKSSSNVDKFNQLAAAVHTWANGNPELHCSALRSHPAVAQWISPKHLVALFQTVVPWLLQVL